MFKSINKTCVDIAISAQVYYCGRTQSLCVGWGGMNCLQECNIHLIKQ